MLATFISWQLTISLYAHRTEHRPETSPEHPNATRLADPSEEGRLAPQPRIAANYRSRRNDPEAAGPPQIAAPRKDTSATRGTRPRVDSRAAKQPSAELPRAAQPSGDIPERSPRQRISIHSAPQRRRSPTARPTANSRPNDQILESSTSHPTSRAGHRHLRADPRRDWARR
jgi:hypothetical protein